MTDKLNKTMTAIITLLFFVVLGLYLFIDVEILYSQGNGTGFKGKESAIQIYKQYEKQFKNPSSLNENFMKPLLGKGQLKTLDKSISFVSNVSCPSSNEFVKIIMQPLSSGDVTFRVYYDGNLDGKIENEMVFHSVSGLCVNGFVICEPGTWRTCAYYTLRAKEAVTGGLILEQKPISFKELNGCFCVNNHCGQNLSWRNREYILKTFGGVVIGAFQGKNPKLAVSGSVVQDVMITYYAQDVKNCRTDSGGGEANDLGNIFNKDNLQKSALFLSTKGSEIFNSASFGNFSYKERMIQYLTNVTERKCTAKRVVITENWDISSLITYDQSRTVCYNSGGRCVSSSCTGLQTVSCGENCISFLIKLNNKCGLCISEHQITFVASPEFKSKLVKGTLEWCTGGGDACFNPDGRATFSLNDEVFYDERYHFSGTKKVEVPISLIRTNSPNYMYIGISSHSGVPREGCGEVRGEFYFKRPLVGCYIKEVYIEDHCESLRNNKDCKLKYRKQNGVLVKRYDGSTGLQPRLKCLDFCDGDQVLCYDDWEIEEVYECKLDNKTYDTTRPQTILSSLSYDNKILQFNDTRMINNNYISFPNQRFFVTTEGGEACPPVCKVKIREDVPDVGNRGPTTNLNMSTRTRGTIRYEYRECKDGVCPLNEGEEKVADCDCLTAFEEAIVSLQTLRLLGEDIICSSGQEKPLAGYIMR